MFHGGGSIHSTVRTVSTAGGGLLDLKCPNISLLKRNGKHIFWILFLLCRNGVNCAGDRHSSQGYSILLFTLFFFGGGRVFFTPVLEIGTQTSYSSCFFFNTGFRRRTLMTESLVFEDFVMHALHPKSHGIWKLWTNTLGFMWQPWKCKSKYSRVLIFSVEKLPCLNWKIGLTKIYICRTYNLTPKGLRPFFSKKHLKTAISSSRSPNEIIFTFLYFQP
jgi:hypothetical protein